MKSCDLKWLADSLAVNRVNKAKKRQCGGELQGLRLSLSRSSESAI